ncbi:unnamed protein product [Phytophthora lilii]|uniref:Unnamed protein product n=1 Tax=Phytophthora lilii TaxID=2077276 RepID=A0A9W6TQX3_9STRA|nr:unnamed protein product [Phytophthora lilii]
MGEWRGTRFMTTCIGMDVSIRVMNGAKWRGVLREVRDNGDVVIRPAQELLYDEPDGDELPEKLLVKSDILWLRRHPSPDADASGSGAASSIDEPEGEEAEAGSPTKNQQEH